MGSGVGPAGMKLLQLVAVFQQLMQATPSCTNCLATQDLKTALAPRSAGSRCYLGLDAALQERPHEMLSPARALLLLEMIAPGAIQLTCGGKGVMRHEPVMVSAVELLAQRAELVFSAQPHRRALWAVATDGMFAVLVRLSAGPGRVIYVSYADEMRGTKEVTEMLVRLAFTKASTLLSEGA